MRNKFSILCIILMLFPVIACSSCSSSEIERRIIQVYEENIKEMKFIIKDIDSSTTESALTFNIRRWNNLQMLLGNKLDEIAKAMELDNRTQIIPYLQENNNEKSLELIKKYDIQYQNLIFTMVETVNKKYKEF